MRNYEFFLTPGYCMYNGAAVKNQSGAEIEFIVENSKDVLLKRRLSKAFENHVEYVLEQNDCPDSYKKDIKINFSRGNHNELRKYVSALYGKKTENSIEVAEKTDYRKSDEAAAIVLLDSILNEARLKNATDIHIENGEVRFRIKGKLNLHMKLQEKRWNELVQRIKLLSGMNVVENRISQDGHFEGERSTGLFVRVSTVPVFGKNGESGRESVVMRLLDTNRIPLAMDNLGFNFEQLEKIRKLEQLKNGLILICGPTGAGKSTTAASFLMEIIEKRQETIKVLSLEDPPEYVIPGVTQIEIGKNGNSFNEILSHIFRQDPDVIMIGEIRDETSAAAALRASLTGHLVVATVHTSSAALSLLRLENLGLERKLLASVLKGCVIQELEYMKDENVLLADVAIPGPSFVERLEENMGEEEIEKLFIHEVNSGEVLAKTAVMLAENLDEIEEQNGYGEENSEISPDWEEVRRKRRKTVLPLFGFDSGGDSAVNE